MDNMLQYLKLKLPLLMPQLTQHNPIEGIGQHALNTMLNEVDSSIRPYFLILCRCLPEQKSGRDGGAAVVNGGNASPK